MVAIGYQETNLTSFQPKNYFQISHLIERYTNMIAKIILDKNILEEGALSIINQELKLIQT